MTPQLAYAIAVGVLMVLVFSTFMSTIGAL